MLYLSTYFPALFLAQEKQIALSAPIVQKSVALYRNGDYQGATKLLNPVNDATDIGEYLRDLGRCRGENRRRPRYDGKAVLRFRNKLAGAADSVGFFYYAGHGVQSNGENYLFLDARLSAESMPHQSNSSAVCPDSIGEAGNKLNIIVLDACRDNPFHGRDRARGPAVVGTSLQQASLCIRQALGRLPRMELVAMVRLQKSFTAFANPGLI